tara:strand:+ start:2642 stop:4078 length:1437 start_codon:yes stop_codon:yes gene_type:complete
MNSKMINPQGVGVVYGVSRHSNPNIKSLGNLGKRTHGATRNDGIKGQNLILKPNSPLLQNLKKYGNKKPDNTEWRFQLGKEVELITQQYADDLFGIAIMAKTAFELGAHTVVISLHCSTGSNSVFLPEENSLPTPAVTLNLDGIKLALKLARGLPVKVIAIGSNGEPSRLIRGHPDNPATKYWMELSENGKITFSSLQMFKDKVPDISHIEFKEKLKDAYNQDLWIQYNSKRVAQEHRILTVEKCRLQAEEDLKKLPNKNTLKEWFKKTDQYLKENVRVKDGKVLFKPYVLRDLDLTKQDIYDKNGKFTGETEQDLFRIKGANGIILKKKTWILTPKEFVDAILDETEYDEYEGRPQITAKFNEVQKKLMKDTLLNYVKKNRPNIEPLEQKNNYIRQVDTALRRIPPGNNSTWFERSTAVFKMVAQKALGIVGLSSVHASMNGLDINDNNKDDSDDSDDSDYIDYNAPGAGNPKKARY